MQFSASILDREAPVDAGTIRIAFFLECMDTPPQDSLIRNTPPQTAAAEHAELDFGHVEPASMLGSVVEPQTSGDASGFVRHKSHIQGPKSMGVEVVEDNPGPCRLLDRLRQQATSSGVQSPVVSAVG